MAFTTEEVVLDAERGVTLSVQLLPTGGWYPGITERPAVLILPGGGYNRPSEREAENVAAPFLAAGYHAMVLRYSAGEHRSVMASVHCGRIGASPLISGATDSPAATSPRWRPRSSRSRR